MSSNIGHLIPKNIASYFGTRHSAVKVNSSCSFFLVTDTLVGRSLISICKSVDKTQNGCKTFRPYVTSVSKRFGSFRSSDVSILDVSSDVSALFGTKESDFSSLQFIIDVQSVCHEREKEGDLTQSYMTKSPTPTENQVRKPKDNTPTPPKTSITQRSRSDLGRSVGVTSHPPGVVKLVYRYPTSH